MFGSPQTYDSAMYSAWSAREMLSKEHTVVVSGLEEGWTRGSLISRYVSFRRGYILSICIAVSRAQLHKHLPASNVSKEKFELKD
jgi:hypothetical protein